jgi:hypothetical protein
MPGNLQRHVAADVGVSGDPDDGNVANLFDGGREARRQACVAGDGSIIRSSHR